MIIETLKHTVQAYMLQQLLSCEYSLGDVANFNGDLENFSVTEYNDFFAVEDDTGNVEEVDIERGIRAYQILKTSSDGIPTHGQLKYDYNLREWCGFYKHEPFFFKREDAESYFQGSK